MTGSSQFQPKSTPAPAAKTSVQLLHQIVGKASAHGPPDPQLVLPASKGRLDLGIVGNAVFIFSKQLSRAECASGQVP
jgi:hypothetical protein